MSIRQKEFVNKQTKKSCYLHSKKGFVLVRSEASTTDIHFLTGVEAEVPDRRAGWLGFLERPLWLCTTAFLVSSPGISSGCTRSLQALLWGQSSILMTSFNLIASTEAQSPNTVTWVGVGGLNWNLEGHNLVHNRIFLQSWARNFLKIYGNMV